MLATVGRSDRHAHAFAQPVWRLVRPHIDHIDLEIRIQRVVVHHGERNILAMLPRAFEAGEAHIVFHVGFARNERPERALWGVHRQHQHLGGGFDPVPITMFRSSKDNPMPAQKRSSASRYTSTSSVTGVPTRWRITAYGRHASSNST